MLSHLEDSLNAFFMINLEEEGIPEKQRKCFVYWAHSSSGHTQRISQNKARVNSVESNARYGYLF